MIILNREKFEYYQLCEIYVFKLKFKLDFLFTLELVFKFFSFAI